MIVSFLIGIIVTYVGFYIWSNRNFLIGNYKNPEFVSHVIGFVLSFFFGFVAFIARLGFSNGVEIRSMPKPWILWASILVVSSIVYLIFQKGLA